MRRYGIFMIGATAAALFASLGFWQLSRLQQRRALRARMEQRERMYPLDLTRLGEGADSLSYRPVTVHGTFDFAHQLLATYRVVDEVNAVYVVTPLRYGDRAVLVERGWTPSADGYTVPLAALAEPDTATVSGVLVAVTGSAQPEGEAWPLHVRRAAPASLARRFPYPLFPLVLRRTHTAGGLPMGLRLLAAPQLDNGPHLAYAIQWFSFAAIAIVGPIVLWRRGGARARGLTSGGPGRNLAR